MKNYPNFFFTPEFYNSIKNNPSLTREQREVYFDNHITYEGINLLIDSFYCEELNWITFVFLCDADGEVTCWAPVYTQSFDDAFEMARNHIELVLKPEEIFS